MERAPSPYGEPYLGRTSVLLNYVFLFEVLFALAVSVQDEAAIAAALRAGDRAAFKVFFERHHADLLRYLSFRNVPEEQADDLVQQAFVAIWERRESLREDGSVRALLYRIAYSRALNHFRDTERFDRPEAQGDEYAADGADPEQSAEARLIRDRIGAAVAGLPERRRAVFELCVLEGFSYREAAETLEISVKTVENQMAHALKAVREALAMHRGIG